MVLIMQTHKTITVKHAELESITCDRCKKVINTDNDFELQEVHSISFIGGYSSVFGDMNQVDCDLCQQCLYELIGDFCVYNLGVADLMMPQPEFKADKND